MATAQKAKAKATTKKAAAKGKRGGARPNTGPKPGFRHHPRTIEKIRASINAQLCIDTLHRMVESGDKEDSVKVQAATVLLRKVIPDLSATDLTSGGEALTIERVAFKPATKRAAKK